MKLSSISKEQRNISILKKIIQYCSEIEQTKERFNLSLEVLQNDFVCKNSIAMCLLQIGELTTRLTDDFKIQYNSIEWKSIKQMRNITAHDYGNFDLKIVWETIIEDIPKLRAQCQEIIQNL
ncbi:MAG: DUF86 domain-containing protein [Planctomycetaceae bacterium]|jgi:uncharacterized protein with HEPN domain|nr:DUF86 domain-containing protein [Planctomycetaceae bacterium]